MADSDTMVDRLVERLERLTLGQMHCLGKRLIEQGVEETHRWPEIERANLGGAGHLFGNQIGSAFRTRIRAESPQSTEEDYDGFPIVVDRELARALDQSAIAVQALLLGDATAAAPLLEILELCAPEGRNPHYYRFDGRERVAAGRVVGRSPHGMSRERG